MSPKTPPATRARISRTDASPSSAAIRKPTTDTGRSISTEIAPDAMSTPTSSISRGFVAITTPSAATTYQKIA